MQLTETIIRVRQLMRQRQLDAYIDPGTDPHLSEYLAPHWRTREWWTGFTGSAGTVVITTTRALLWTDGRYFIQAAQELSDTGIEVMRMQEPGVPTWQTWLRQELSPGSAIGIDGKLFPFAQQEELARTLESGEINLDYHHDLVAELWRDRPALPATPVTIHSRDYAGERREQKLARLRKQCTTLSANSCLVTQLDDIAWLLNIRANDIEFLPVAFAWLLLTTNECVLFIDAAQLTSEVLQALVKAGVIQKEYHLVAEQLSGLDEETRLLLSPADTNCWLLDAVGDRCTVIRGENLVTRMKSPKNAIQIRQIKNCQLRDGVAMVRFLRWLEEHWQSGQVSEMSAIRELTRLRAAQDLYCGHSFRPISAWGSHAAMMHYSPTTANDQRLSGGTFYLFDSGGQYLDGTTDITRTVALGEITREAKRDFTLALKCHIALARAVFLAGTRGSDLEALTRQPVWERGIDYKCGSGHGLGQYLSVHEKPQKFDFTRGTAILEEGMLITNEPGVYREGVYGIRHENTLLVVPEVETESGRFLKFETISYCPLDSTAVDITLLTAVENEWLNDYHRKVREQLSPGLEPKEVEWLRDKTNPL